LEAERKYTKSISNDKYTANNWTRAVDNAGLADDTASNFQVLIQNVRSRGDNVLTRDQLLLHAKVLEEVASMTIEKFDRFVKLSQVELYESKLLLDSESGRCTIFALKPPYQSPKRA